MKAFEKGEEEKLRRYVLELYLFTSCLELYSRGGIAICLTGKIANFKGTLTKVIRFPSQMHKLSVDRDSDN